jgi:NAD(P)H-hydrate repair Nnr-like enzyme with NAD(P)H-hydrate epimerase domain
VVWSAGRALQDVIGRLTQGTQDEDQDESKDMQRHVVVLCGTGGATGRAFIMVVGLSA